MKKVLVCIGALLLTACNSTLNPSNDTVKLVNASKTEVISYHKTDKKCEAAKTLQSIRAKANWASNSVATRTSHFGGVYLPQCEG